MKLVDVIKIFGLLVIRSFCQFYFRVESQRNFFAHLEGVLELVRTTCYLFYIDLLDNA